MKIMRIIAGKFKGRILEMPKGVRIRPSSQKVKEALFNVLGPKICETSFLELFAGSGNIGIEAKSRGAGLVTFVENNRLCIRTIEKNLLNVGIKYSYGLKNLEASKGLGARILPLDAERAIQSLYQKAQKFDFIFLDPPYYRDRLKNCLLKICRYDILKNHSCVIVEHSKRQILPQALPRLKLTLTKRYGDNVISFYQKDCHLPRDL